MSTRSTPSSFERGGQRLADDRRIGAGQRVALDVDGAIGAARQRFAQRLGTRAGPAEQTMTSPAVLLLEAQGFFERVGVGLVQLEAGVPIANPRPRLVDAHRPLARDDLLETDGDLHGRALPGNY